MNPELGDTIVALSGGVANLDPDVALQAVRGWTAVLDQADFPHADELRDALGELAGRLERREFDGIGDVLARLGNLTTAVSSYAPKEIAEDVMTLGEILHRSGSQVV